MEKSKKQKINLGVFVVITTIILIGALYFIGNRQQLFQKNTVLKAQFHNVNGLQVGNNVRFSGINVGTVGKMAMTTDSTILVEMRIRKETADFIRKNAIASIGSDGLVGNMLINISPSQGQAALVTSGDTIATYSKIATDDMLSTLSITNQNASLLTADLLEITSQILEGKGTLGMLVNDPQVAQDLKESITQIKKTSLAARETLEEIKTFSSTLQTRGSMAYTLLSDTLSGTQLKNILRDVEVSSGNLVVTTSKLEQTIAQFENEKGTYNYLVKDTLLPKNIEATIRDIKRSSSLLNDNMEALQHNFLLRGYFKKQERKARKEAKKQKTNTHEN